MMRKPSFYGVLIGIDHYLPNTLPDGNFYPPLRGCVRDVQQFEMFFLSRLKLKKKYIYKLIAPHPREGELQVPANQQPTYENMVDALQSVTKKAQTGDLIWIYYAGHGGRTPTQYEAAKGPYGHDEVLVPVNIGTEAARYLRDVELGTLLKEMVDKGLIVTIVLDCCHSGGATRGNEDVAIRGISSIDTTPRPTDSLVAPYQILSENWLALQRTGMRGFEISSGWLPQPEGYVLLAACRDFEGARESQLYGPWHNGVFTYYLLDALRQMSPESTYKMLYNRVRAKVHARFGEQTPQLEGERDRVVFGSELIEQIYAVNILDRQPREDHGDYYVELDAGQLHTLQEGAQFWVYPNPARGSLTGRGQAQSDQPLAHLEISELYATSSRAVISAAAAQRIEAGDQAVLITPVPLRFSRKVRLVHQKQFTGIGNQDRALGKVEAILQQRNGAFVRLAAPAEVPDFLVTINEGIYEIQDIDGRPIHHLRPELPITLPDAAERLVERLIHLTKYRNVLLLENQSGHPSIVGKLHIELRRMVENADTLSRSEAGTSPLLEPGDKIDLVIRNDSWQRLHVAILDLAHDWSIKQLYPPNDTIAIEPQMSETLSLQAMLSNYHHEGTDTLKVFAAYDVTDFSWLSLPALDQPITNRSRGGGPRNALEELMEFFMSERRGFRVMRKAEWEWTSVQVEIYIRRR